MAGYLVAVTIATTHLLLSPVLPPSYGAAALVMLAPYALAAGITRLARHWV